MIGLVLMMQLAIAFGVWTTAEDVEIATVPDAIERVRGEPCYRTSPGAAREYRPTAPALEFRWADQSSHFPGASTARLGQ